MNNCDLAQEFANGARSGEGSHMIIDGDVIYSYGKHFPMAIRKGDKTYVNIDKYSQSTSRHQSYVRSALRGNVQEVTTKVMQRIIEGECIDLNFKKVGNTATAKAIVKELEGLGFTAPDGSWEHAMYGQLPVDIMWRKEYKPNCDVANMGARVLVNEGRWMGRIEGKCGKVIEKKFNIADAILA